MSRRIYLDLATTGLDPTEGDQVIELAALIVEAGELVRIEHQYFDSRTAVSDGAWRLHGISSLQVSGWPVFLRYAVTSMQDWLCGTLYMHNAQFRADFLDAAFDTAEIQRLDQRPDLRVVDLLALGRRRWPDAYCTLDDLCDRLGVDRSTRGWPRSALTDALLVGRCAELLGASFDELISGPSR